MPSSREVLQMEASNASHITFNKGNGCYVTRKLGAMLVLFFVASIVTTAALVLYFSLCTAKEDAIRTSFDAVTVSDILDSSIAFTPDSHAENGNERKFMKVRLPRSVVPDSYEIKLIPFLLNDNFTFSGEVLITVNATEDADRVTLHVKEIEIEEKSVVVKRSDGGSQEIERFSNDTEQQVFVIHTRGMLRRGEQYRIGMKFTGILNDKLQGFYRSSYTVGNTTRWIATTQFQATDARRAFPCFDEPAMKAKFKLFIGRPKNMSSLSNMPQINNGKPVPGLPDYVWDEYEQSVPMSTYLVAFVVSDFVNITSKNRFAVWARSDAISQAKYALEIGPKCLKYFEEYFDIDFPLPKVDMIALPDFAAGAMENWGLITYRETAMLYEEGISTRSNKQRVATVVAHELAHQWFGNLVTPVWWSDLWLNEGFASYVEYLGVEAVEPSWKILEQFVTQETQNVFALDALRTSHPISIEVHHPDEISEIFDRISYGKGASIIRMMDHFLTSQVFKSGLTRYLKRHKYSNAEQDDLWRALTEQAHEDRVLPKSVTVKTIMDTWTLQTGFPVVTVSRNYDNNTAVVVQEKFLLYKPTTNSSSDIQKQKALWWIPITYTSSDVLNFTSTYPSEWMRREKSITIRGLPSSEDWVIFNVLQTGFYRVNYDERNWKLLIKHLKDKSKMHDIIPTNRAQLIDDSLNLARAGLLNYSIAMDVTQYLYNELDYLPWESALIAFSYLDDMLIRTAGYDMFEEYILKLIQKVYEEIGFRDDMKDPQLVIYKRIYILSWACALGHEDCVKNSVKLFKDWMLSKDPDSENPISPNLKSIVYCTAIRVGGEKEWNFAWERYLNSNVGSEKDLILEALGCSSEIWILSRYLDWSMSETNGIRKQDVAKVFGALSENPVGQMLAFKFLRSQWQKLKNYLGPSMFSISTIVRSATKWINNDLEFSDLVHFAKQNSHDLGAASRAVDQVVEQAAANIRWMESNYETIVKWLTDAVR
ncbi:UNVERIFIED_CONTAM: hypothetical protein PYX00_008471 [Menopon gallinae]|uniref:Aminopeptidase n=1 Tax=Menopon gallinae TaxID=328185 RepID=A0AAW2HNZ7_9NEOP